jgi:hypothetical protein
LHGPREFEASLPRPSDRKEAALRVLDSVCHDRTLTCHRKHWARHFTIDLSAELQSASPHSVVPNGGQASPLKIFK